MIYTKRDRLIDRINANYSDFKARLNGLSCDTLLQMTERIAAVSEARALLTTVYGWSISFEIDFYLLFRDPLIIVADAWEKQRNEPEASFGRTMTEILFNLPDDIIAQYLLAECDDDICLDVAEDAPLLTVRFEIWR